MMVKSGDWQMMMIVIRLFFYQYVQKALQILFSSICLDCDGNVGQTVYEGFMMQPLR